MKLIKLPRKKIESPIVKEKHIRDLRKEHREKKEAMAKKLVEKATASELKLKAALEKKGYVFIFQSVVGGYIADFHFVGHKKIVELDGKFHGSDERKAYDRKRDEDLRGIGIQTLRIGSSRMFREPGKVMEAIEIFLGIRTGTGKPKKLNRRQRRILRGEKINSPKWKLFLDRTKEKKVKCR